MKIVILDGHGINPGDMSWDFLNPYGTVICYERTEGTEQTIRRIGDAEIVLLNKTPITEGVLSACPNLRLICILATGYNIVDCRAAAQRNIPVCNVPGYSTAAVAQFTFGLLLELCHHIGHHSQAVRAGKWSTCPDFCFWDHPQMELAGKTIGIIGYGNIGRAVGKIAQSMGMQVLACSRTHYPGTEYAELDTLLKKSDVVSLHCPLFPENAEIINRETIAKMKDGAILLNTARGGLINETAVAEALESGKLRGVAVDVVATEPIPETSPLLTAPNCIVTPHIAWAPMECRTRVMVKTEETIRKFLAGESVDSVNL